MSQTKFTKGKWKLHEYQTMALIETDKGAVTICEIEGKSNSDNCNIALNEEQKANAHLIAAAPDMYAMIKELSSELESAITNLNIQLRRDITSQSEDEPDYWDGQTIHEAQLLLKKARGE